MFGYYNGNLITSIITLLFQYVFTEYLLWILHKSLICSNKIYVEEIYTPEKQQQQRIQKFKGCISYYNWELEFSQTKT